MTRKNRVNFSLDGDVVDRLEEQVERGERSSLVEDLLDEELD